MAQIILFGFLTLIFGLLIGLRVFLFIRKKVQGKKLSFLKEMFLILLFFFLMVGSGIYTVVLIGEGAIRQVPKVVDASKEAISSTVAFGTEAVFEGVGRTAEHFNQKWEEEYQNRLNNISIEVNRIQRYPMINHLDSVVLDVVLINKNKNQDRVSLNALVDKNYILIGDSTKLYYPVQIISNQQIDFVPSGKSQFIFQTAMPDSAQPVWFRLLDHEQKVQ